ncbi:Cytidylate kinase [Dictyocoela muelleri]|nr:Cytidylate kinase [Dictyocoela muelleri]
MKMYKIAIDGPAGVGKSSTADLIAQKLNFKRINSGEIYRTITFYFLEKIKNLHKKDNEKYKNDDQKYKNIKLGDIDDEEFNVNLSNIEMINKELSMIKIEFKDGKYFLNDVNCSPFLHNSKIDFYVSKLSKMKEVREKAREVQQRIISSIEKGCEYNKNNNERKFLNEDDEKKFNNDYFTEFTGIVMDGRDIGTVVMPDADLKIFLTADPRIRAERRFREMKKENFQNKDKIENTDKIKNSDELNCDNEYLSILESIQERDNIDMSREIAPLKKADDAILLDNSKMSIDEVDDKIIKIFEKRFKN